MRNVAQHFEQEIQQVKFIFSTPTVANLITIGLWLPCAVIATCMLAVPTGYRRFPVHLFPVACILTLPALLGLHPIINRIVNIAENNIDLSRRNIKRIAHGDFTPMTRHMTMKNAISLAMSFAFIEKDIASCWEVEGRHRDFLFLSLLFFQFLFVKWLADQFFVDPTIQIIGRVTGTLRSSYSQICIWAGHPIKQPISQHDFSNMTNEELTCVISLEIPKLNDAVIIASDSARQVYSRKSLEQWMKSPFVKKDITGKILNFRTNGHYFTENEIIPVPEIVKEQIRAKHEQQLTM